ncbi:MAG TPA: hypothetical protein VF893_01820 [Candidatus Bathyarchaeia archaeon]
MKNHLIRVWATHVSDKLWRWKKIDRKITALSVLLMTAFAAVVGGLLVTTNAANAADTNSTTSDTSTLTTAELYNSENILRFGDMGGMMIGDQRLGGGHRGHGLGFMGGIGNIEVSSEYKANVNAILDNDTDVQGLVSQGYNITSINPIVKSVIEADGTLVTKATTAVVTLQNGTSGFAIVRVEVSEGKVTQIVIITRTVIDKTSS